MTNRGMQLTDQNRYTTEFFYSDRPLKNPKRYSKVYTDYN